MQAGIISTCNGYAEAPTGSYCSLFVSDNGITLAELYAGKLCWGVMVRIVGQGFWRISGIV